MKILCRVLGHNWRCKCGALYPQYDHYTVTFGCSNATTGPFCVEWAVCSRCGAEGQREEGMISVALRQAKDGK